MTINNSFKILLAITTIFIGGFAYSANADDIEKISDIEEVVEQVTDKTKTETETIVKEVEETTVKAAEKVEAVVEEVEEKIEAVITKHSSENISQEIDDAVLHEKHGEKSGLPQFDISTAPSQIFWLFTFFALMYIFFSKKTLPEISATIENRHLYVQTEMDNAEKFTAQAKEAQVAYEKNIEMAKVKSMEIIKKMDDEMKALSTKKNEEFKENSYEEIRKAESDIATEIDKIIEELPKISAQAASIATKKIANIEVKADMIEKNIETAEFKKDKAA